MTHIVNGNNGYHEINGDIEAQREQRPLVIEDPIPEASRWWLASTLIPFFGNIPSYLQETSLSQQLIESNLPNRKIKLLGVLNAYKGNSIIQLFLSGGISYGLGNLAQISGFLPPVVTVIPTYVIPTASLLLMNYQWGWMKRNGQIIEEIGNQNQS